MGQDEAFQQRLKEAIKLHFDGVGGNKQAVQEAYERFTRLRAEDATNALLEAYYGSTLALIARDAAHPLDKADWAQQSLDMLDRAVSMDPNSNEIRFIRASVCVRLPENFFQRSATAIADFRLLLDRYEADPECLTPQQAEQAVRGLSQAWTHAGKPSEAAAALQLLKKFNLKPSLPEKKKKRKSKQDD